MSNYQIPLSYNAIDHDGLHRVLEKYKAQNHQLIIRDFEDKVRSLSGAGHVVALSSGTAALHLALKVLGVGMGDKVLVSTFTYVASVSPILYCGASPIFIDSEETTWNVDPQLLEEALTDLDKKGEKAKAIIVVHAYGMPAQLDKILSIAKKWNVPVIEDAAEAFGATIDGKWAGTLADIGVYSFNNNKTVTTFGGGVLFTDNKEWANRARKLATHARDDKPFYEHHELGYNYAMSPLTAAYGLSQLKEWNKRIDKRRDLMGKYQRAFSELPIRWQKQSKESNPSCWLTTMGIDARLSGNITSEKIRLTLEKKNIESRPLWKPMHLQPLFSGTPFYGNGVAENLFHTGLCLPSGSNLSMTDQDFVIQSILELFL